MAKKTKVNKSQAVRDYCAEHPEAKPAEVAAALAEMGIQVTPQAVSTIKYQAAKKSTDAPKRRGRPRKGEKATPAARTNGRTGDLSALLAAKALADQVGGVEKAKQLLDTLAKLRA
jgi:hypothetical protein